MNPAETLIPEVSNFRLSAFGHRENVIEAVERIKKNLELDAHITPLWYPEGEHTHVEDILQLLLES